jgi:hypothetical protein
MSEMNRFDDGNWYAASLGEFIGMMVDCGQDPAVKFRVIEDLPPSPQGHFIRRLEVVMLPNGVVEENLINVIAVREVLKEMLEAEIVK